MTPAATSDLVAIVGAGPAGLRAVQTLARYGRRVVLLDEATAPGGQIYRQPPVGAEQPAEAIYGTEAAKAVRLHGLLAALGDRVDYRPRTLVWNIAREGAGFRLDLMQDGTMGTLSVGRLVLATGAFDRTLPFPNWTLPGVFTLGAAQIALKSQGIAIGRRIALIGAGPLLPLLIHQYLALGIKPVVALDVTSFGSKVRALPGLLAEPATLLKGLRYVTAAALRGVSIISGVRTIEAHGDQRVEAVAYTDRNGRRHSLACDAIAASFGLRAETQLADLAGCEFTFDAVTRQWLPMRDAAGRSTSVGVYLAGDGAAIGGADVAELTGQRAALALLSDTGHTVDAADVGRLDKQLQRQSRFRRALDAAYPFPSHLLDQVADSTLICRCEGITAGAMRDVMATREPTDVNRLKAFSRVGMGRCQGRMCGHVAAELLAGARRLDVAAVGALRPQPPIKPLPLSALTSGEPAS